MIDPRHPVLVGAHELAIRSTDAEPVAMMVAASRAALAETGNVLLNDIDAVHVVKGIWPYTDPGRLVADDIGLAGAATAITQIGGNATYDLVNETAALIASGGIRAALVCGAESMRTRRKDKSEGRRSTYLSEQQGATPTVTFGNDVELVDDVDIDAGLFQPVNFYAMAESVIRHERGETPNAHLQRISELWARGSDVASSNPHAWLPKLHSPEEIAAASVANRMVAAPYTKLLTSNINVDQGAAVVLCSYELARERGIDDSQMVFLVSGSGAYDHLSLRQRQELHCSPAFDHASQLVLSQAGIDIDDIDHLDLYSCFPASVQLAQASLGVDPVQQFTITGGLTFAGGPFNGYCTQALAHAVPLLRGTAETAFLYGNGGFFSKHSIMLLSGAAPKAPFSYSRPQADVDAGPIRAIAPSVESGRIEAYTVTYDRHGNPEQAICAVLDDHGSRHWAVSTTSETISSLLTADGVGRLALLTATHPADAHGRASTPTLHLT